MTLFSGSCAVTLDGGTSNTRARYFRDGRIVAPLADGVVGSGGRLAEQFCAELAIARLKAGEDRVHRELGGEGSPRMAAGAVAQHRPPR